MTDWSFEFARGDVAVGVREALCTLGKGYLGTRGAAPEHRADGTHYPGTYVAGCYNRLTDVVEGVEVANESLVNVPNWLALTLRAPDGPWLGDADMVVLNDHHELDLRQGILTRRLRVRDPQGRLTDITQDRLVHQRRPHVCALRTTIMAGNWDGNLLVRSTVDAGVRNAGVARYQQLSGQHLHPPDRSERVAPDTVLCATATTQSRIRIAVASRTRTEPAALDRRLVRSGDEVGEELTLALRRGTPLVVEKVVTVFTSRDRAISTPDDGVLEELAATPGFQTLAGEQTQAWEHLWRRYHLTLLDGPTEALTLSRLHQFHVLQSVSRHGAAGVPARGLHGEAYRGHILWDELFVLPMLSLRTPEVARESLMYRYRRLPAARRAAAEAGHAGAMYPWQSGSSGREENQRLHLNPLSGRWVEDLTDRQRHVGLAVAYNTWQYCQATGDRRFLDEHGAEMMLEVARFFADLAEFDPSRRRFVIRGVMGPDEFHTGYPCTRPAGVDNNAYTNILVAWLLQRVADALRSLPADRAAELRETLGITPHEERRWRHLTRRLYVPIHHDGVISQFEGYEGLEEFPWDDYRKRHPDVRRLDRILELEGDDPNRYKASKQADVLMLLYLFSADELRDILGRLGYPLPPDAIPRTVDYYLARTSHGSTLSAVVHAWVLARSRRADAIDYLREALHSDVDDVQGGTTAEGIHLAAMAGSVDLLQRCFAGVETRADTLMLNPRWPPELGRLELDIHYRRHRLRLHVSDTSVEVTSAPGDHDPIRLRCRSRTVTVHPGQTVMLDGLNGSRP